MNRRQALIGIGSLAVGSGAALGSGAFTSVEADRTVDVTLADDSAALLGIAPAGPYTSDSSASSENAVTLDIGAGASVADGLNDDAVTELGNVIQLTNNAEAAGDGTAPGVTVDFLDSSDTETDTVAVGTSSASNETNAVVELTAPGSAIGDGNSKYATATVYTGTEADNYSGDTVGSDGSVTIVAST
ncbi:hypothetical protein [Halosimplex halophilum]|uniref:hypothetical protein n=1 Tax=Halosimplex halophilum TaxID=2559572 RepID=UPI00107F0113|nr:hypothetical protein [Halosimplex halophilum]